MEAATLQKKKTVNKGKIKKTLKNVLCRPDPVFWPLVSEDQKKIIEAKLSKHSVEIPEFKKPHWNDLKLLPKEKRPKAPKIKRIDGLFFGVSECCNAIKSKYCAVVLVEATVQPRAIVQPVIEACIESTVPVICVNTLRPATASNFGIPTSCLGIKCDCLPDLRIPVLDIAKNFQPPQKTRAVETEIEIEDTPKVEESVSEPQPCPYLYRSNKKARVFNPSEASKKDKNITDFSGQNFIEFSEEKGSSSIDKSDRKSYMKMVLKKISNNPKRVKVK